MRQRLRTSMMHSIRNWENELTSRRISLLLPNVQVMLHICTNQKQETTKIYQNVTVSFSIVLTYKVSERDTDLTVTQYVVWLLHNEGTVLHFMWISVITIQVCNNNKIENKSNCYKQIRVNQKRTTRKVILCCLLTDNFILYVGNSAVIRVTLYAIFGKHSYCNLDTHSLFSLFML